MKMLYTANYVNILARIDLSPIRNLFKRKPRAPKTPIISKGDIMTI